jgi:hypothetical protein
MVQMGNSANVAGMKVNALGIASAAAAVAVGVKLGSAVASMSKEFIKAAGELEMIDARFRSVFGDSADAVLGRLGVLGQEVGRSTTDLRDYAATFMDTLQPLGIAADDARKMSEALVELTVDTAAFQVKTDADVIKAYQSALTGMGRSVLGHGVLINEATVKQEAYRLGIVKSGEELTEVQKILARYSLLVTQQEKAHGFATKAAGKWQQQMVRLAAFTGDLREEMGNQLIPVLQKAIEDFGGMEAVLAATRLGFQSVTTVATEAIAAIGKTGKVMKEFGLTADNMINFARAVKSMEWSELSLSAATLDVKGVFDAWSDSMRQFAAETLAEALVDFGLTKDALVDLKGAAEGGARAYETLSVAAIGAGREYRVREDQLQSLVMWYAKLGGAIRDAAEQEIIAQQTQAYSLRGISIEQERLRIHEQELALKHQLTGALADEIKMIDAAEMAYALQTKRAVESGEISKGVGEAFRDAMGGVFEMQRDLAKMNAWAEENRNLIDGVRGAVGGLSAAVGDAAVGFGKFGDMAENAIKRVIANLISAQVQAIMLKALMAVGGPIGQAAGAISGVVAAKGAAFSLGRVEKYARGGFPDGFIGGYTPFPIRGGIGIAGERGPEVGFATGSAIAPLKKDPVSGDLGVRIVGGQGGGQNVTFHTTINVAGGAKPDAGFRAATRRYENSLRSIPSRLGG